MKKYITVKSLLVIMVLSISLFVQSCQKEATAARVDQPEEQLAIKPGPSPKPPTKPPTKPVSRCTCTYAGQTYDEGAIVVVGGTKIQCVPSGNSDGSGKWVTQVNTN